MTTTTDKVGAATGNIRILAKKAFRFKRPGVDLLDMGTNEATIKQPEFKDLYFDTVVGDIQTAPAWIKQDKMWEWAVKDGDLMEISVESQVATGDAKAIAAAQQHADGVSGQSEPLTDHHVAFLRSRGYVITDVAGAARFVSNLSPAEQKGFMAEAAEWAPDDDNAESGGPGTTAGPVAAKMGGTPEPPAPVPAPSTPPATPPVAVETATKPPAKGKGK